MIDWNDFDSKIKYADGYEPTEEELQTIIIDANGLKIVWDYMGNYSIDTDKYYAYLDDFYGGEVRVRYKILDGKCMRFELSDLYRVMKVSSVTKLTHANEADRIFDRLFNLKAFL